MRVTNIECGLKILQLFWHKHTRQRTPPNVIRLEDMYLLPGCAVQEGKLGLCRTTFRCQYCFSAVREKILFRVLIHDTKAQVTQCVRSGACHNIPFPSACETQAAQPQTTTHVDSLSFHWKSSWFFRIPKHKLTQILKAVKSSSWAWRYLWTLLAVRKDDGPQKVCLTIFRFGLLQYAGLQNCTFAAFSNRHVLLIRVIPSGKSDGWPKEHKTEIDLDLLHTQYVHPKIFEGNHTQYIVKYTWDILAGLVCAKVSHLKNNFSEIHVSKLPGCIYFTLAAWYYHYHSGKSALRFKEISTEVLKIKAPRKNPEKLKGKKKLRRNSIRIQHKSQSERREKRKML